MPDRIHIVVAANDAYGPYCAATIRSLFRAARRPSFITSHVLTADFTRRTADMVARAAYENGGRAEIHRVDLRDASRLPTLPHITTDTYSRILAAELLPLIDRFIYLDCDMVVLDDIALLHELPLNGNAVGGVAHRNSTLGGEFAVRYHLDDIHGPYVNAGVLLIDSVAWRARNATAEILQWMNSNVARLLFSDQDAINHYFRGRITELPVRWNIEARHFTEQRNGVRLDADLLAAMRDPAIIHYTGVAKPWSFDSHVPRREHYLEHLERVLVEAGLPKPKRTRRFRNIMRAIFSMMRFRVGKLRRSLLRLYRGSVGH